MKDDYLTVYCNDKKLVGIRRGVKWEWACEAFPSLVQTHNGCSDVSACLLDFMKLCLEPSLKNKEVWEKGK